MILEYEKTMDRTIAEGTKRLTALFETYRHKKMHFTAMQKMGDDLAWIVENNILYIEFIEKLPNQIDNVFRSRLCGNFDTCHFNSKEIKEVIHWFTKRLKSNTVIDWDLKHKP